MKCKACDAEMGDSEVRDRIIIDECGTEHKVEEDLCRRCRDVVDRCASSTEDILNKLDELLGIGD
jgi:hypothetical protein